MTNQSSIYYNSLLLLSYKRLYNLIVSVRGLGKTYHFTKKCIDCGLLYKRISFVVLVRYKEDIKELKDGWWSIVEHLYPNIKFFTKSKIIYAQNTLEDEIFPIGEFVSLTEYARAKRKPRPYVKWIMFDEFLNEDNNYLPDEITKFLNVCDSIIRNRNDVRVILISNTISIINPYFDYFGFTKFDRQFSKGEHDSLLEFNAGEDFIAYRKTTKFGASIIGTEYGEFAMQGKFMLDDTTNVIKNPIGKRKYMSTVVLDGISINLILMNNILFLCENKDKTKSSITPYVDDARLHGAMFVDKSCKWFRTINTRFMRDEICYETLQIKNAVINLVRFLMGNRYK